MNKLRFTFFILMNIINYVLVVPAVLLYKGGSPVTIPLFLSLQLALIIADFFASENTRQLCILSINLLISTIVANILSTQLYYHNISSDAETLLVGKYEVIIGSIYVIVLSCAAVAIKYIRQNKKIDKV